uniref:hypothetical protein n=1 Tax=Aliagarivorans TaxID=882379 RepID=UPI00054FA02D
NGLGKGWGFETAGIDFGNVAVAALAGGASSHFAGGTFRDGARTGALANLFNEHNLTENITEKMVAHIASNPPDGQWQEGMDNMFNLEVGLGMSGSAGYVLFGHSHELSGVWNTQGQWCLVKTSCLKIGPTLGAAIGPSGSVNPLSEAMVVGETSKSFGFFADAVKVLGFSGSTTGMSYANGGARWGYLMGAGVQMCTSEAVYCM